jgi:hypothetical protein
MGDILLQVEVQSPGREIGIAFLHYKHYIFNLDAGGLFYCQAFWQCQGENLRPYLLLACH